MSDFVVLDAACRQDREAWLAIWNRSAHREPFAHPAYVTLFAANGRALCAIGRAGALMVPFILRPIDGTDGLHDVISPYAYGGPFGSTADLACVERFWQDLTQWEAEHRVVSEFMRFSLDASIAGYPGQARSGQDNVVCSVRPTLDEIWRNVEHKVRKNVQKADRSGITVESDHGAQRFDDFWEIYRTTMDRRAAAAQYYFEREFFDTIHEMSGSFTYFHALLRGEVISSELVLLSSTRAYSFLGGTRADHFALRPNDCLKHRIICWTKESGREAYVLGGGYGCNDGIFRYKQSFAPNGTVPFFTGRRILNLSAYMQLVDARRVAAGVSDSGFFPAYRA
jgi:hypothetical protein